jgi:hypothetical protein
MELSIRSMVVGFGIDNGYRRASPFCLALSLGLRTKRGRRTFAASLRSRLVRDAVPFRTRLVTQIRRLRAVPCGIMLTTLALAIVIRIGTGTWKC